jgi:uncharacterized protein (DUF2132 family)
MAEKQINNPLHGLTLAFILWQLEAHYGFEMLGQKIAIKCFTINPSIKSSLSFLRKTDWARSKVETLFLRTKFNAEQYAKVAEAYAKQQ